MHLEQNIPLAPYTTLRIGGPARYFVTITSEPELLEALAYAREHKLRTYPIGGGSNLVIPDEGFDGLILHLALKPSIQPIETDLLEVSGGTNWDDLVLYTCRQNLSGMECLAGIPGLVGASPIQNIGAYGQDVSHTIVRVRALDLRTQTFLTLTTAECGFAYRHSIFNSTERNRYLITSVLFHLQRGVQSNITYADLKRHFANYPNPSPLEVYAAVRDIRDRKGMLIDPAHPHPDSRSAGSFFKNPIVPASVLPTIAKSLDLPVDAIPNWPTPSGEVKLPAAWLIERAGFAKGFELGNAGISTRHTLALVNRTGTATCADLFHLRDHIIATVQTRFQITLEQEPVILT